MVGFAFEKKNTLCFKATASTDRIQRTKSERIGKKNRGNASGCSPVRIMILRRKSTWDERSTSHFINSENVKLFL